MSYTYVPNTPQRSGHCEKGRVPIAQLCNLTPPHATTATIATPSVSLSISPLVLTYNTTWTLWAQKKKKTASWLADIPKTFIDVKTHHVYLNLYIVTELSDSVSVPWELPISFIWCDHMLLRWQLHQLNPVTLSWWMMAKMKVLKNTSRCQNLSSILIQHYDA